jgi:hypothetical protein
VNGKIMAKRHTVNRRAFLHGAGGVALGLPFLEGLLERSAWAADAPPVFTFFMCGACGVEPKKFWPSGSGALAPLLAGKSVEALKDYAENLLLIKNMNFPLTSPSGCGHAQGLCQALTGKTPTGSGNKATATGPSVDYVISKAVNPAGTDPMTLYAGNVNNGYIADRLSFDDMGRARASVDNPYKLYQALTGLVGPGGTGTTTGPTDAMAEELIKKRKSVNDSVRSQISSLLKNPKLSAADKQRLQQHFDSIRDAENSMTKMGQTMACSLEGVDVSAYDALKNWKYSQTNIPNGGIENIVDLHLQLVALAFACNYNRTGTLQWGDGTDPTIYQVPSNTTLGMWKFHFISHRTQSDSASGTNATAEAAHAEIDVVRMQTLAKGLKYFKDRGLQDKSIIVWTNHIAEGFHTMRNVPFIVWGNGGGHLKQNLFVDAGGVTNGALYNVVISAATGKATTDFGSSAGKELTAIKA